MTLEAGTRVGSYRVMSVLGVGGMGEVYRAHDAALNRDVALKVLPTAVAADPGRLMRLRREAQTLASLTHPHIAVIHGLVEDGSVTALVLELIDGTSLDERLRRGPVPVTEALPIARQIAEALEAAHDGGVVHRDLKPANIRVTREGIVKVLDFGLAKALDAGGDDADTVPAGVTRTGAVMGTPAYMSPEQARGERVDRRADIWAFGVVLFELLTGTTLFGRSSAAETLSQVLTLAPDFSRVPPGVPSGVLRLLRRCLEKDPRRRLQHIGDARIEIEEALAGGATADAPPGSLPVPGWRRPAVALAAAAALVAAAVVVWFATRPDTAATQASPPVRLTLTFREPIMSGPISGQRIAISPDGTHVALVAGSRLWVRDLARPDAVALPFGLAPFFSPDGELVASFDGPSIWKRPVTGAEGVKLAAISGRPTGGSWHRNGTIVFATTEGLFQMAANGGQPRLLAAPDRARNEALYMSPRVLPDGRAALFTIVRDGRPQAFHVAVIDLDSQQVTPVLDGGASAEYLPTGHLVFAAGTSLHVVRFDAGSRRIVGEPIPLDDVQVLNGGGMADYSVAANGTLVSLPPVPLSGRTLQWVDRSGRADRLAVEPRGYAYPRISPDGTRVALDIAEAGKRDIWILDLQRVTQVQLTDGPTEDMLPVWSPDGRIVFSSNRSGNFDVYSQDAAGGSPAKVEFSGPGNQFADTLTPDGRQLILNENFQDASIVRVGQPATLSPLFHTRFDERLVVVSPNAQWIAYESNESGDRYEIVVRSFPDLARRREVVSRSGGRYPLWSRKGDELYYVTLDGVMMAVPVTFAPELRIGAASKLFDWVKPPEGRSGRLYDVGPDGRFLTASAVESGRNDAGAQVSVVLNWLNDIERRVAPR